MNPKKQAIYKNSLIELKKILLKLDKLKTCTDNEYNYLCQKLGKIYQKLQQNHERPTKNPKSYSKRERTYDINEFFANG